MVWDSNFKLKKPDPFVSMTHYSYFSKELVAWLHEPQANVSQKVRQKHFFGIELKLFYNAHDAESKY